MVTGKPAERATVMDLRTVKTERCIRSAFLSLCEKEKPEKIKVVDVCSLALINKTTFYKHYKDIPDLTERMELDMFRSFWENFDAKDELLKDPAHFIKTLPEVMDARPELVPLFHGRYQRFFDLLEKELFVYYLSMDMSREEKLRLRFLIHGLVCMFMDIKKEQAFTSEELAEVFYSFF